jgi:hypothetical protein
MKLSHFDVMHARGDAAAMLDDPLVVCFADKQRVLAYVSRQALMDYFRVPGDRRITLEHRLFTTEGVTRFTKDFDLAYEYLRKRVSGAPRFETCMMEGRSRRASGTMTTSTCSPMGLSSAAS